MAGEPKPPVLVVDDYQTMVRIIRNLLKQIGFLDVDEANDGAAALDRIRQRDYGLIISDWHMEPMTGYELLRTVRAADRDKPFIMVTSETDAHKVSAAKTAGVSNYVVKPFGAATLKANIEAVFDR